MKLFCIFGLLFLCHVTLNMRLSVIVLFVLVSVIFISWVHADIEANGGMEMKEERVWTGVSIY